MNIINDEYLFWCDFEFTKEFLEADTYSRLTEMIGRKKELEEMKNRIELYYNNTYKSNKWNDTLYKLFPFSRITFNKKFIISRAYYKLSEILKRYDIKNISSVLLLCEAPGGFVQCIQESFPNIKWRSLSLPGSIPFSEKIDITNGNIIYKNIITHNKEIRWEKVDLITADGGIDSYPNYNLQEEENFEIIKNEIEACRHNLKKNGIFILKIFDMYKTETYKLLVWLSHLFIIINLCKPPSSKPTNSEKYVVCKGFKDLDISYDDITVNSKRIPNLINWIIHFTVDMQLMSIKEVLDEIEHSTNTNWKNKQLNYTSMYLKIYGL